ncbi:hypothetical protein [uncultured Porphyromonas sp.]|uniref:hypothetical protein n=1 Tax=uncultured Porphyromonas sp. TaxID=159274 RepID=UPI00260CDAFB|nr:hypothetical protein [uncultured Porphyromonas sp.]
MTNIQLCTILLMGLMALLMDILCGSIGYSLLYLLGTTVFSISLSMYWRDEHDKLQQQIKDYTRKYGHK